MRSILLPLVALCVAALGCDAIGELRDRVLPAAAERPEGWQSLEGDAAAQRLYYQFVDASRRVRFVERLEDVPEAQRATVGFVKTSVPPPLSPGDAARARRAQRAGHTAAGAAASGPARVVLYSAEWCGACRKAKRHLTRRNVDFEVRDIDQPRNADELLRKTGARAIPVLEVDGSMLTGFSAGSYDELLERV